MKIKAFVPLLPFTPLDSVHAPTSRQSKLACFALNFLSFHSLSLLCSLILLFTSCSKGCILNEEHSFNGAAWNRFTPEEFDVKVNNTENYYNIDITVAVDTLTYRYETLPVMLILNGPNGEERQFYGAVVLKDKGRWRGEIKDGLRVASGRIRSYFSFNTQGTHHLKVSHTTSQYDLEGVDRLAVSITRAKVDYDL